MLKVLAIYPAFDVTLNEMAMVWKVLTDRGNIYCAVVTRARDDLKGNIASARTESHANLDIYRLPDSVNISASIARAMAIAKEIRPDLIFCAVAHNMPCALTVSRALGDIPVVLHTEFFSDERKAISRRHYLGIPLLRPLAHRRFVARMRAQCKLIFCSNPVEVREDREWSDQQIRYLPWPHPRPDSELLKQATHDPDLGIFIGSISRWKGADTLQSYACALLNVIPRKRLLLIGPAVDKTGRKGLVAIQKAGGDRVEYKRSCSRREALQSIGKAAYVISPGQSMGWGLIGDAWSMMTPVIAAAEHYDLKDGFNCLIARNGSQFVEQVRRIEEQCGLREALIRGGATSVAAHGIAPVAEKLLDGLAYAVASSRSTR